MSRRLDDVRLAVMMLDGLEIAERTHVVALGITTEGVKIPLGLWEGSTENATLIRTLLADFVDRGLDPEQAILFVIDGGKALRRAIKDVFGEHALVHRCHRHKECHEAMTSAAGSSLGGVHVPRRCRHAAVRGDRLGDAARAMVRGHVDGHGHRRGLGARRRGRPRRAGHAPGARGFGVHGDDERRGVGARAAAGGRLDGADRRRAQGQGGRIAGSQDRQARRARARRARAPRPRADGARADVRRSRAQGTPRPPHAHDPAADGGDQPRPRRSEPVRRPPRVRPATRARRSAAAGRARRAGGLAALDRRGGRDRARARRAAGPDRAGTATARARRRARPAARHDPRDRRAARADNRQRDRRHPALRPRASSSATPG